MTDKEILDEVYRRLCFIDGNFKGMDNTLETHSVRSFIEQEWQKEDDRVNLAMYNRNRPAEEHIHDVSEMHTENSTIGFRCPEGPTGENARTQAIDVKEIERSRGLEIGEDGTVEEIK
jgi:hypothetical protein